MKKLQTLRTFLHQVRCLVHHPEAGEDLYSDLVELVYFVERCVEPKLTRFTPNFIENAKRNTFMMLKYAAQDLIEAVNARRRFRQLVRNRENLLERLRAVHERLFEIIFDPTYSLWLDRDRLVGIVKDCCRIMSRINFNFSTDVVTKDLISSTCFFCHMNASIVGVGRIEGICEDEDGLTCGTFTDFTVKHCGKVCDHLIGDVNKFKTPYDFLLSSL